MAKMKFGDMEEVVVTRQEFPLAKAQKFSRTKWSLFSDTASRAPRRL